MRERAPLVVVALSSLAIATSLAFLSNSSSAQVTAADRPNVLIFITDDMRDRGGSFGAMEFTSNLFSEGVRYKNAFVTTPQCCPSRSSIFSGQYIHNHGVTSNEVSQGFDSENSLQRHLQDAGYETALYGNFLNGFEGEPPYFDDYSSGDFPKEGYPDGPPGHDLFVADQARRFIDDARGAPWAVVAAFKSPHAPYSVEDKYASSDIGRVEKNPAMQEDDFSDKNPQLAKAQQKVHPNEIRDSQIKMLLSTDDAIERIWGGVVQSGEADNTVALFISDNGFYWGEHDLKGKYLPYLDSVRVPLHIRWPVQLQPGTDKRFALNIDIAPTIYDALDIAPSYEPDGKSLLDPTWDRKWVLFEGASESDGKRWPNWEAAYYDGKDHYFEWENGFREHYNLKQDPYELSSTLSPERTKQGLERANRDTASFRRELRRASDCTGPLECP